MAESNALNDASIGDLRALAKSYGIKADRKWARVDFVKAILSKQEDGAVPTLASDDVDQEEIDRLISNYSLPQNRTNTAAALGPPKPGYARVILHKDPTPNHANSPVHVGLNGRLMNVPRGVAVDLPIEYLGVLRDAVHHVRKQIQEPDGQNPDGKYNEEEILSYPYQIVAITPGGKFVNKEDQRSASATRRKAFHNVLGRWPTDGELHEWEKTNAAAAAMRSFKEN